MMKCKWCGMESKDPQICEWCKRVMATGQLSTPEQRASSGQVSQPPANPTMPLMPTAGSPTASPPATTPMGPSTPTGAAPPPAAAPMGPATPPRSTYTTTTPTAPGGGVRILYEIDEGLPFGLRLEKFLAISLPLAAINLAVLFFNPSFYLWSALIFNFLIGLWLPVSGIVKNLDDEDYRDTGIAVVLGLLCGPTIALVLYGLAMGILSLTLKIDSNWSVMGILLTFVLFDILFRLALFVTDYSEFGEMMGASLAFMTNLPVIAIFAGWFMGGFFRPTPY
jgi:hypothetical protein